MMQCKVIALEETPAGLEEETMVRMSACRVVLREAKILLVAHLLL